MFIVFALFIALGHADDVVTLKKDEKAPFAGTLLSPDAAAKIIVESDYSLAKCRIDYEKKLSLQEAELKLIFKNKQAELAACHFKSTEMTNIYEQQIKFLEKQAYPPVWQGPALFIGGVLTGTALVYGSSLVLKNIGE
jgi:hypothetical protein